MQIGNASCAPRPALMPHVRQSLCSRLTGFYNSEVPFDRFFLWNVTNKMTVLDRAMVHGGGCPPT